jgi:hypothetical protein
MEARQQALLTMGLRCVCGCHCVLAKVLLRFFVQEAHQRHCISMQQGNKAAAGSTT